MYCIENGSTNTRNPSFMTMVSSSAGWSSMRRLYLNPEQPPGCTLTRRPPTSGATFSASMNFLTSTAAAAVISRATSGWLIVLIGLPSCPGCEQYGVPARNNTPMKSRSQGIRQLRSAALQGIRILLGAAVVVAASAIAWKFIMQPPPRAKPPVLADRTGPGFVAVAGEAVDIE